MRKKLSSATNGVTEEIIEEIVQHSKDFEKIKNYYECKFWTKEMVKNTVVRGKITPEEYKEVTGEPIK